MQDRFEIPVSITRLETYRKLVSTSKLNMAGPVKRRDFIKAASLLGSSIAIADGAAAGSFLTGNANNEIKNENFKVSFDKVKGKINIYRNNGIPFLTGATVCANTGIGKRSVESGNYQHSFNSVDFR